VVKNLIFKLIPKSLHVTLVGLITVGCEPRNARAAVLKPHFQTNPKISVFNLSSRKNASKNLPTLLPYPVAYVNIAPLQQAKNS
jgi:hypothetical protein